MYIHDIDDFIGNIEEKQAFKEFLEDDRLLCVIDGKSCIGKSTFIRLMLDQIKHNIFHIKYDDDVYNTMYNLMLVKTITEFMRISEFKLIIIDDFDIIQEIHQNIHQKIISIFEKALENNIKNVKVVILLKESDRKLIFSNINALYLTIRGVSIEECRLFFRDFKYFEKDIVKAYSLFKGSIYHINKYLETCEKEDIVCDNMLMTEKINMFFEIDVDDLKLIEPNNVCYALYHNIHEYIQCKYNIDFSSHEVKMKWYSILKKISQYYLLGGILEYKSILTNNWSFQEYGNIIRMYSLCLNMKTFIGENVKSNSIYIGKNSNIYSRSVQHHNNNKKINHNLSDHNIGYLHMMTIGDIYHYKKISIKNEQLFAIYIYTTHICNNISLCPKKKSIIKYLCYL